MRARLAAAAARSALAAWLALAACSPVRDLAVVGKRDGKDLTVATVRLGPLRQAGGVLFRVNPEPGTYSLTVTGNFNQWHPDSQPLERDARTGVWSAFVPLEKKGRLEFKYVRNGAEWLVDPFTASVDDGYGGKNSVFDYD